MKHARDDYNRIQDPTGKIGSDEPVFLVRAQDLSAPACVRAWADDAERRGADPNILRAAREHATLMEEWQQKHGAKVADL